MRSTQKVFIGVAVVVAVIAIGVIIGLLGGGSTPVPAPPPEASAVPQAAPHDHPTPVAVNNAHSTSGPVHMSPVPQHNANPANLSPQGMPTQPDATSTNWEDKLNEVLASEDDDTNKAKVLLEMFPNLPEDGQVEVTEHLLNLLAGGDYTPLAQMMKDPKLAEAVQDVIMSDALNWPNATKLPLLLDVAKNPDHPKAAEAKDWLELYVGEDYGTNWNQWNDKVQQEIKDNPDE